MQALFSVGTEGGVGNVLGASLCILADNHPGSEKIRDSLQLCGWHGRSLESSTKDGHPLQ